MTRFTSFVVALVAVLSLWSVPSQAQTYIGSTTLSAAVTATATSIRVASAASFSVGEVVMVDREAMTVSAINSTTISVFRGAFGTQAVAHGSGATAIVGPPQQFVSVDPAPGTCTASDYPYLPLVNYINGNVWLCRYSAAAQTYTRWVGTNNVLLTYNSLLLNLS